jgi:hypothetical protein
VARGVVLRLSERDRVGVGFRRPIRSVFIDEKKLSIAALSQTLPDRLIEQSMPWSAIKVRNCSLVYWLL